MYHPEANIFAITDGTQFDFETWLEEKATVEHCDCGFMINAYLKTLLCTGYKTGDRYLVPWDNIFIIGELDDGVFLGVKKCRRGYKGFPIKEAFHNIALSVPAELFSCFYLANGKRIMIRNNQIDGFTENSFNSAGLWVKGVKEPFRLVYNFESLSNGQLDAE